LEEYEWRNKRKVKRNRGTVVGEERMRDVEAATSA
jgi:hypothetical protein